MPVRLEVARQRHADRQRRHQGAGRYDDHRRPFPRRRRRCKKGDLLFTLDGRAIEAQIAQTEGTIARDQAQLDGAERDVAPLHRSGRQERHADGQSRQCQDPGRRLSRRDQGRHRRCWRISRSSSAIAPSPRRSAAASARPPSRSAISCARPIPRRWRPSTRWRRSMSASRCRRRSCPRSARRSPAETATIEAIIPGDHQARQRPGDHDREHGRPDHRHGRRSAPPCRTRTNCLWPGTLVTTELTLARSRRRWSCPRPRCRSARPAISCSSSRTTSPRSSRSRSSARSGDQSVIASGLNGGETVVTDGQLLLSNGARVNARQPKPPVADP